MHNYFKIKKKEIFVQLQKQYKEERKKLENEVTVGEIPRNKPTGYGDIIRIQLPNSKLGLCVSKIFLSGLMKNRTMNH